MRLNRCCSLLLLMTVLISAKIVQNPCDLILFVSNAESDVTFVCKCECHYISWRVNDTTDPTDIRVTETYRGNTTTGTLFLQSRLSYNATTVQCIGRNSNGEQFFSNEAVYMFQGYLDRVSNIVLVLNGTGIEISWIAPFSLDVTGVDHDIWYSVIIYNVTDENNPTVMDCTDCINITDTHYTFTPNYLNPCHIYNFSIIPYNGAGQGEYNSNITLKLNSEIDVSKVEIMVRKPRSVFIVIIHLNQVFCQREFSEVFVLYYTTKQKMCPSVVSQVPAVLSSKNEWMIVSEVSLGVNCDYTLYLSSHNSNTTLYFSTKVVIVEVRQEEAEEKEEGEVEMKCVFRHTLSDSCYVQLVSDVEGGFHQKYCVEDEKERGEEIARFSNLLPATYTILVNGLTGENSSCSSGGDTPDYITVITVDGPQPTPIISQSPRTVESTGPLSSRVSNPLCAEGIGIGVCFGVFSTCLLFIFGMITIKVVVKMKGRKDRKTLTVAPAQKLAMKRNMAYELHKPPSLRRDTATISSPTQITVYEDLK